MNIETITIEKDAMAKLMGLGSGDCALLYLYLRGGNSIEQAARELGLSDSQFALAVANLRQTGLWTDQPAASFIPGQRPAYTETDVMTAMDTDMDFRSLYGEVQRQLGKVLTTEELKLLLGLRRYLKKLPREDVGRLLNNDPDYFFNNAPYALAMGVINPYARAFGRRKLDQCPYLYTRVSGKRTAEEWGHLLADAADLMDYKSRRMQIERWTAIQISTKK